VRVKGGSYNLELRYEKGLEIVDIKNLRKCNVAIEGRLNKVCRHFTIFLHKYTISTKIM